MKELGVGRPEDLPPHLRTKSYTRRKTQDSFVSGSGQLMPKPGGTQSPAPGSTSSPGQSQGAGRSATPSGIPRNSTGNAPANGAFDPTLMADRANAGTPFDPSYAATGPGGYVAHSPSPFFSPGGEGPGVFRDGESRNQDPSFTLFRPSGLGIDVEDDIRNGLTGGSGPASALGESLHVGGYGDMFMDDGGGREDEPVPSLEHETSHASEALEMIASNEDNPDDDVGTDAVEKEFEGFLNSAGGEAEEN